MSIHKWIQKLWLIYTMEYYSALEKNKILLFAALWIDLEGIMLSKISQTRQTLYDIICVCVC